MPTLTSAQASALAKRRKGSGRPKPRSQIIAMQDALLKAATDKRTPSGYKAQCARAWDVLEERLRIMSGKPLPGQLRPDLQQKAKSRKASVFALPEVPKEA